MPTIDAKHPQYERMHWLWRRCRDCVEGEDAVKSSGEMYLPVLYQQYPDEYDSYKLRAHFYAAADRTVKGLAGAVMRKPPNVEFPEQEDELLDRLGDRGENLTLLCKRALEEVITTGRLGLYVDAPPGGGDPYVAFYFPENIINWKEEVVEGRKQLTRVVLCEEVLEESADDPYVIEAREQYRVLKWEKGQYTVEIWEQVETPKDGVQAVNPNKTDGEDEKFVLLERYNPKGLGGNDLGTIPFLFVTPTAHTADIDKPPILDLVNVNLSHYRNSADLEHGLHFTALPQAWVAGFNLKGTELRIGSSRAWTTDEIQAKAGYLEFSGQGLGSIRERMKDKEQLMAILGARLLEEQKADSEAAETVKLRHAGEDSVLSHLTKSVSAAMTQVLKWVAKWKGHDPEEVSLELNTDFDVVGLDPTLLAQLMAAVQGGLISWDTWFYNLKRGEIVPDSVDMEDEKEKIQTDMPLTPPAQLDQASKEDALAGAEFERTQTALDKKLDREQKKADIQLTKKQTKVLRPKPAAKR